MTAQANPQVPKGYKQTEIGVIPEDWGEKYLGDICERITTGKLDANAMEVNGLYRFYTCAKEYYKINSYAFDTEALLVSGNGANVGYVHYYSGKFNAYQRTYVLSGFKSAIHYIHHYLSEKLAERIRTEVNEGNTPYIVMGTLTGMKIPLPPTKAEQEAIAEALGDADAWIDSLETLIEKKRKIKQGTMQELFTGRTRLPGFEGEWVERRLGDVVDRFVGGGTPSRSNSSFWKKEIPWVTVKDFSSFSADSAMEYISHEGLKLSASNLIPAKTLITSTRMALGNAVIYDVDVAINQDLKALFTSKELLPIYLFQWFKFNGSKIEELGSGSTVKGISLPELRKIDMLIPPNLTEQTAITQILSDMDDEIEALESKLQKARRIKEGMMGELLTGKTRLVEVKKSSLKYEQVKPDLKMVAER